MYLNPAAQSVSHSSTRVNIIIIIWKLVRNAPSRVLSQDQNLHFNKITRKFLIALNVEKQVT